MTTTRSSENSVLTVTPDSRFATSFLSTKYRDRAVAGEALMDKTTGELFIKRVSDGKIVSFYQNKKMINDLVLELRVLLTNNETFEYPSNNETAFYISTNYDLVAINNETQYDISKDNIVISGSPSDINKLTFKISGDSNGFFCRNTTRDVDKIVIEYVTNHYNSLFKEYDGVDALFIAEHNKFSSIPKWETSNAILLYDVVVTKNGSRFTYNNNIDYIRVNEDSCVILPDVIYDDLGSFDYAEITIKSITYHKLHFMIANKERYGNEFVNLYNKLIHIDNRIEVAEFNVTHFIDSADDIQILGNESIISFLDIPNINRYMGKMAKLKSASSIITSITKPNAVDWSANTVWAERIRDFRTDGTLVITGSQTSFDEMESFYVVRDTTILDPNLVSGELAYEGDGIVDSYDFKISDN